MNLHQMAMLEEIMYGRPVHQDCPVCGRLECVRWDNGLLDCHGFHTSGYSHCTVWHRREARRHRLSGTMTDEQIVRAIASEIGVLPNRLLPGRG